MKTVAATVALVVGLAGVALAEPEAEPEAKASPAARNLTKTRPGSFLKKDTLWDEPADLRGEAERRRDAELLTHYRRMAELDVIGGVAQAQADLSLQERVEDVRRKELERHHLVMMRLRQEVAATTVAGAR